MKGLLVVVSAPSGTGKTTICQKILNSHQNFHFSISMTTRSPRQGEKDGIDYFFVSEKEFLGKIASGELVEWAKVYSDYYGTPKTYLENLLSAEINVLLDIDSQGAIAIKKLYQQRAVLIFILPPSLEELKLRLSGRMTDNSDVIEKRMSTAKNELKNMDKYDYCVVNDNLESTMTKINAILIAEQHRVRKEAEDNNDDIKSALLYCSNSR